MPATLPQDQSTHHRTMRLVYFVLAAAGAATLLLPSEAASVIAMVSMAGSLGAAAWMLVFRTGSLTQAERRAWQLLGIGLFSATTGLIVHATAWIVASDVPTFGPIDLFWLLGYALGIAGIAALPHTAGSKWHRLRLLLDALIGAVAMGTILWTVTLRGITGGFEESPVWERMVGSSYVVLDALLLVVLVTAVIRRSTYRFDRRLVFIGVAVTAQAVGDYTYLTSGLGRTFNETEPIYAVNILAAAMFLAAASNVRSIPHQREYADRISTPAWAVVVPYGLAATLFVALLARFPSIGASATDRLLLHATVVLGVLVIARQGVTIRESRRMLDDQRADLAASISHELRTPLTSVVGFLDLLAADFFATTDERREMTTLAADQAAYLSRVVADLLILASDNDTQIDLQVESLTINELVGPCIEEIGIDPDRVRADSTPGISVFLDKSRIQQAITCLVTNALRYGGGHVEITTLVKAGDLTLEVHDDGPGVPRKYELLIWEKFERGPYRLSSSLPGSGIGLAITRAIAEAHGGSAGYNVSSRLGGSCFWIRLPGRVQFEVASAPSGVGQLSIVPAGAQAS